MRYNNSSGTRISCEWPGACKCDFDCSRPVDGGGAGGGSGQMEESGKS